MSKPVVINLDLTLYPTVKNNFLKYYTVDTSEGGTSKHYMDRDQARRIAKALLEWADTEEVKDEQK